jgi:septal ring factor EnvC (AmiA/AmiB activator)
MGSDPQSYLQYQYDQEHKECNARIAELEAELAHNQRVTSGATQLNERLERELAEARTQLQAAGEELAEERARLQEFLKVVRAVHHELLDANLVVRINGQTQFLTLVLHAAIDAAKGKPR